MSRKQKEHQVDIDGMVRYLVAEDKFEELQTWLDKNAVGGENIRAVMDEDEDIVIDLEPTDGAHLPEEVEPTKTKEKRTKK